MGKYLEIAASVISRPDAGYQCEISELSEKSPSGRLCEKSEKSPGRSLIADHKALIRRAKLAAVPDLSDPEDIRTWLHERSAIREDSGAAHST